MKCWKGKRVTLKLPSCAFLHWQTHLFSTQFLHCGFTCTSHSIHWFPDIFIGPQTQIRDISLFPRITFSFSLRTFWVVKPSAVWRGQKYKWAQKISKQINRKVYCPLWLLQSRLLLPVHKSLCQYLLSGRADHFLPFCAFTTGHCQWKSLELDGHLCESVWLFLLFNYWKYGVTDTVFSSQQ